MKRIIPVLLTIILVFSFSTICSAEATFTDDFSDSTKCVAKSSNIIFESENPSLNSTRVVRQNSDEGYVIWRLEGLYYIELNIAAFESSNPDMNNAINIEVSNDANSWQGLNYSLSEPSGSGWVKYILTANVNVEVQYIKITLTDTGDVPWAVVLESLSLYNENDYLSDVSFDESKEDPPITGDNTLFIVSILFIFALFVLSIIYRKRILVK